MQPSIRAKRFFEKRAEWRQWKSTGEKSPVRFYTKNLVADLQYILTDTKCEIEIIEPELLLE